MKREQPEEELGRGTNEIKNLQVDLIFNNIMEHITRTRRCLAYEA